VELGAKLERKGTCAVSDLRQRRDFPQGEFARGQSRGEFRLGRDELHHVGGKLAQGKLEVN
jgi:hypothetical protein